MADRATQIANFYESTIVTADFSAGATSFEVESTITTDGVNGIPSASVGDENTWFYLVIDPDSSTNREIVVVKTYTQGGTTFSNVERDYDGRQEQRGAAADTGISHGIDTTVRMAVLAQHIQDQNDRVATNIQDLDDALSDFTTEKTTAINNFVDDGNDAIADINAASATAMINNATDGTSTTVDVAADYTLIYDVTDSTAKKVYVNQVAPPVEVHPFIVMGA